MVMLRLINDPPGYDVGCSLSLNMKYDLPMRHATLATVHASVFILYITVRPI